MRKSVAVSTVPAVVLFACDDTTLTQVRPTGGPYDAGVFEGTFAATCPAGYEEVMR